jgi:hypothetical protein
LFHFKPKECAEYPGYYCIPGNDRVVASPDGKFINLRTGNPIKPGPIYDGYWKISICVKGKTTNWAVHRLLAKAFINKPIRHNDKDYSELEVNHINGNKSDNTLSNLEWVTHTENSRHAINHYLTVHERVLARNIKTNKTIRYPTSRDCAKDFNINDKRLRRHLKSKEVGTKTKKWFVFKIDDGTPWPELRDNDFQSDSWDIRFGIWYAKNIKTNKLYFNNTLEDLCNVLQLKYTTVQKNIRTNGKEVYFGDYAIWFNDQPLKDVVDSLPKNDKRIPESIRPSMRMSVEIDGITTIHDSITKASKATGLYVSTITYNLKKKQGIVKGIKFKFV